MGTRHPKCVFEASVEYRWLYELVSKGWMELHMLPVRSSRSSYFKTNNLGTPKSGLLYDACFLLGATGSLSILLRASQKIERKRSLNISLCSG